MTRGEIETFTKFIMLPNSRQATNSVFTPTDITNAVQRAYEREWNEFCIIATRSQVVVSHQFTWPSGQISMPMPRLLQGRIIHSFFDITDNPQGIGLRTVFYIEDLTKLMRWPSTVGTPGTGPFRDTLLRAFFLPHAEALESADQTPVLIPPNHHQMLAWSAAVELVRIADGDGAVNGEWKDTLTALQTTYWQQCKVAVLADRARILPDDAVDFFYLGAV
jgi:hypothetical protein